MSIFSIPCALTPLPRARPAVQVRASSVPDSEEGGSPGVALYAVYGSRPVDACPGSAAPAPCAAVCDSAADCAAYAQVRDQATWSGA